MIVGHFFKLSHFVLLLILTIVLLLVAIYSLGLIPFNSFDSFFNYIYQHYLAAGLVIMLLIWGLWSLTPFFMRADLSQTIIHASDLGEVNISLNALDSLIKRLLIDQKGIRDSKATLKICPEGLSIKLLVAVSPEMDIPHITAHLQSAIRDYVTKTAGVSVSKVEIFVKNISTLSGSKVE